MMEAPGNFQDVHILHSSTGGHVYAGHRRCPNTECRAHVFVLYGPNQRLLGTYPAERVEFDPSDLPDAVRDALEEAVSCHAVEAYAACGMMVRKTLELVCDDRGAEGKKLYNRIEALREKVVLPQELLDGLHDLRLLGNDAAHVESRVYAQVGKDEVELALDVTKEVLKSVYQLSSLVERLRALKLAEDGR